MDDTAQNLADYIFISLSSVSGGNLRDGYATTDIHIFDDGDMWASLVGNWSSPQLKRLGVLNVRLDMRVSVDPAHNKFTLNMKMKDEADREIEGYIPTAYVIIPEKVDPLASLPKYATSMADCAVVVSAELFMHRVNPHWHAVLKHFRTLTELRGRPVNW